MTINNSIKSRIQLKNDTEVNWKKSVLVEEGGTKTSGTSFIPLQGELIIYSADEVHPFFRLKVGDGITNVVQLPFVDAETIHGMDVENIVAKKVAHKLTFGANGAFVYDGSEDVTVPTYTGTVL